MTSPAPTGPTLADLERMVREVEPVDGSAPFLLLSYEWSEDQGEYGWEIELMLLDDRSVFCWRTTLGHVIDSVYAHATKERT